MKKWVLIVLFIPSLSWSEQLKKVLNPETGVGDFITALSSTSIQGGTNVTVSTTSSGVLISVPGVPTLIATQTWSGQNNWTTPAPSTFTFGVIVGSLTVNGGGAGQANLTEGAASGVSGVAASHDVFWADASSHAVSNNFNNSASTYTTVTSSWTPVANQYLFWAANGPNSWVVGSTAPAGSGGGGGGTNSGGAFQFFVIDDTNSVHWEVSVGVNGNLISATVGSIPAASLYPNTFVIQDASFGYWKITITTQGNLVSTSGGSSASSIVDVLLNDSTSRTWILSITTGGNLVTT